jgi:hypothetical protein
MSEPGFRSRYVLAGLWLAVGAAMMIVPVWLIWTRLQVLLNAHPSTAGLALGSLVIGVLAVGWAIGSLFFASRLDQQDRGRRVHRSQAQLRRRATGRILIAVPALIICIAIVAGLIWIRPFPATDRALRALQTSSTGSVRAVDKVTWYELVPNRRDKAGDVPEPSTGLVFAPGARIDSRAYAALLRPLAEAGYLVAVLKEPFGVALLGSDQASTVIRVHPEIDYWAVGGHSLGAVSAARYADTHPATVSGLALLAGYPAEPLTRADLKIISISGSADRICTPEEIEQNKAKLPAGTGYQVIDGAVHGSFGDYGEQPGDGVAGADRAAVQALVVKSVQGLLASLPPKKK